MQRYIPLLLLIILLTSCATKVDVDIAKPVETPGQEPIQKPKDIIQEPKEIVTKEPEKEEKTNIIEIKEDAFYPKEKIIEKGTEIRWIKKDARDYRIACYFEGNRVVLSPSLKRGDTFTYSFLEEGEYTCITSPYGLRNIIKVETQPLLSPTGNVVLSENKEASGTSLVLIAVIAITIVLFFKYGKKR